MVGQAPGPFSKPGLLDHHSLSPNGSPFPLGAVSPTWETAEGTFRASPISPGHFYPEHCHQPTRMAHLRSEPGLISQSLESPSILPGPASREADAAGLGRAWDLVLQRAA